MLGGTITAKNIGIIKNSTNYLIVNGGTIISENYGIRVEATNTGELELDKGSVTAVNSCLYNEAAVNIRVSVFMNFLSTGDNTDTIYNNCSDINKKLTITGHVEASGAGSTGVKNVGNSQVTIDGYGVLNSSESSELSYAVEMDAGYLYLYSGEIENRGTGEGCSAVILKNNSYAEVGDGSETANSLFIIGKWGIHIVSDHATPLTFKEYQSVYTTDRGIYYESGTGTVNINGIFMDSENYGIYTEAEGVINIEAGTIFHTGGGDGLGIDDYGGRGIYIKDLTTVNIDNLWIRSECTADDQYLAAIDIQSGALDIGSDCKIETKSLDYLNCYVYGLIIRYNAEITFSYGVGQEPLIYSDFAGIKIDNTVFFTVTLSDMVINAVEGGTLDYGVIVDSMNDVVINNFTVTGEISLYNFNQSDVTLNSCTLNVAENYNGTVTLNDCEAGGLENTNGTITVSGSSVISSVEEDFIIQNPSETGILNFYSIVEIRSHSNCYISVKRLIRNESDFFVVDSATLSDTVVFAYDFSGGFSIRYWADSADNCVSEDNPAAIGENTVIKVVMKEHVFIFEMPATDDVIYGDYFSEHTIIGGVAKSGIQEITGTYSWSNPMMQAERAGVYSEYVIFTPDDDTYSTIEFSLDFEVLKKNLTLIENTPLTYNGQEQSFDLSLDGIVEINNILDEVDYNLSYGVDNKVINAGTYTVNVEIFNSNYEITETFDFTVDPKALTITATASSKTYGGDDFLNYTYEGIVGGDTISGALSREDGEDAGTYQILQGTLDAGDNYTIVYIPADFTINKKYLLITAQAASKTFGENDPVFSYTSEGLINDDTLSGSLSRTSGEGAGTYQITLGTLTAGNNYSIDFVTDIFTINPLTACDILSIVKPQNAIFEGNNITYTVGNDIETIEIEFSISPEASLLIAYNNNYTSVISESTATLNVGENLIYIKVTAQDQETAKEYVMTITREGSDEKEVLQTGNITIDGQKISLNNSSETMTLEGLLNVSDYASYRIFSDSSLTSEVTGETVNL